MPLFDVFWTIAIISLFFACVMLLFRVFADILRSHHLSGLAKAVWALFVVVLPLLGTLAHVAMRGKGMTEPNVENAVRVAGRGSAPGDMRRAESQAFINTQGL